MIKLASEIEQFLEETRAERDYCTQRAKVMSRITDRAWKLKRDLEKLEEMENGHGQINEKRMGF